MKTLEQAAIDHAFQRVDGDISRFDLQKAFQAGAEWMKKEFAAILDRWEEHAILGMKVGASAYHQGKIALICDLRDYIKEN